VPVEGIVVHPVVDDEKVPVAVDPQPNDELETRTGCDNVVVVVATFERFVAGECGDQRLGMG
jgi:hypothetical protein